MEQAGYQEVHQIIGGEVYVVGGFVRDLILDKDPKDIDIIVRLIPANDLHNLLLNFGSVSLVGKSFGVFKFIYDTTEFDIALPRKDTPGKEFMVELYHNLENSSVFKILYGGPNNEMQDMPKRIE